MPVRIADSMKQMNDLNSFPVAYGSDIWLDKNKGSGTPNYDSIQNMLNNDELGGGSAIQVDTLPIASEDEFGRIYQYTGDSGTYQNGFFYRCDYVDNEYVWTEIVYGSNLQAGDGIDITDDTISVKDRLEEVDELPTPTAELLNEKKCYLLRSEQTGFVRGSVYHIDGSEEQLVNGTSVSRTSDGSLDDYEEYFDTTGSHSDYNKKYTPKSNVVVLCKNFSPLTPYKEVAYFIAESQALRVHYADGSNDETFNYGAEKLYIKALVDLAWIPSGTNLDFDSDNFEVTDDTVSLKDDYKKIFTGTHAEWDELSLEEKKSYDEADFTDDVASGFPVIDDAVIEGSKNPVTSDAVYNCFPNMLIVESKFTTGQSTAIGETKDYSINVEKTGYTALGIVGVQISSGGRITLTNFYLNNATTANVRTVNNGTTTYAPEYVIVYVLYLKN